MQVYLYGNGSCENHGCEAIYLSTDYMLHDMELIACSNYYMIDKTYLERQMVVKNVPKLENKYSLKYLICWLKLNVFKKSNAFYKAVNNRWIQSVDQDSIAFSCGGDNYCYAKPNELLYINHALNKKNIRTVLWGCSVDKKLIDEEIIKDLNRYSLIVARETNSYQTLLDLGLGSKTRLFPDPAFILPKSNKHILPDADQYGYVGINISPLILKSEQHEGIILENYKQLIHYILNETNFKIALIPHVVVSQNDDRKILNLLFGEFKKTDRVNFVTDCSCLELKSYISSLRFFIAARTHASIAAYSTGVPTIVLGYSVKANGIAKDVFGTCENYVLPVQELDNKMQLTKAFCWLQTHETEIRSHLKHFMTTYCEKAKGAVTAIKQLVTEDKDV